MKKKLTAAILAGLTLAASASVFAATPEEEIQDLKMRIAALEKSLAVVEKTQQSAPKTAPNITITGESRLRFQTDDNDAITGTSEFDLRQRLYLKAKVNDHVSYTGRLEATFKNDNTTNSTVNFNQNYFTVTDFGMDKLLIGRVPAAAGMHLNVSRPSNNDGFILEQKAGDVTFTGFVLEEGVDTQFNGIYASTNLGKSAAMAIGYTRGDAIGGFPEAKSLSIGAYTKLGQDDVSLAGEYVDSNNTGVPDADAWAVQVTKGLKTPKVGTLSTNMTIVDKSKPHTQGYTLGYRHVETNGLWRGGDAAPFNASYSASGSNITNNMKGWYLGYQNVMAKNTILTLEYQDLEQVTGTDENQIFTTHVQFFF